jgi:hypothetical protein
MFVYFSHRTLKEYDQWEQFESIQRLPQIVPLIQFTGQQVRACCVMFLLAQQLLNDFIDIK